MPNREAFLRAKEAAVKALEIDPSLPEGLVDLGAINFWYDWDWAAAEKEFRRAIELRPDYAPAHEFYGWMLVSLGRFDEGLAENKRAVELDPLSAEVSEVFGQGLYFARRYDEAILQLRAALDLDPNYWFARVFLARAYERQGRLAEAAAELEKAKIAQPDVPVPAGELGYTDAVLGKYKAADQLLEELLSRWKQEGVGAYDVATVYFGLGDRDQGFAWLDKAFQDRSWYLTWLKVEPRFDPLRADPRFKDLLRRVGLPP
jgi:tetratricopeptide (TPR) repeat protein